MGGAVGRRRNTAGRWAFLLLIAAIITLLIWVGLAFFDGGTDTGDQVAVIASALFAATALFLQVRATQSPSRPDVTDTDLHPEQLRLRPFRQPVPAPSRTSRDIGAELVIGLTAGLVFSLASWFAYGFAYEFSHHSAEVFVQAFAPWPATWLSPTGAPTYVAAGLILGLLVGISYAFVYMFSGPNDGNSAVNTWDLLSTDRGVTLFRVGLVGLSVFLVNFILVGGQYGGQYGNWESFLRQGFLYGFLYGSFAALTRLFLSAWGGWLLFARLWLPLTGRLPWRPKLFLDDAHDRGVLRQSGAVYRFRHVRLRDHLVDQHRAKDLGVPKAPAAPRTEDDHGAEREAPKHV
ncbi:hypothetical protein ACTMTF_40010 [Nonomuraea sp. ZG12]|uniref:hypothetical protein n=1 Tax=Nonomuraea sp. ZG12 TaxID=3452207 RepID=UPI003F88EBCB